MLNFIVLNEAGSYISFAIDAVESLLRCHENSGVVVWTGRGKCSIVDITLDYSSKGRWARDQFSTDNGANSFTKCVHWVLGCEWPRSQIESKSVNSKLLCAVFFALFVQFFGTLFASCVPDVSAVEKNIRWNEFANKSSANCAIARVIIWWKSWWWLCWRWLSWRCWCWWFCRWLGWLSWLFSWFSWFSWFGWFLRYSCGGFSWFLRWYFSGFSRFNGFGALSENCACRAAKWKIDSLSLDW